MCSIVALTTTGQREALQSFECYILCCFITVPDDLVLQLLQNRLAQLDAVTKGWVIHGFPKTREQAEALTKAGYEPNR